MQICGHLLRCCEKINPQRIKDTPAVNFFSRLGSTSPICKRLTEKGCLTRVSPLLKTVLNVSVPPRMAVVPRKNEICAMQISQVKNVHGCTFLTEPAVNLCSRLVVSERTGMSVVSSNGDVFAPQKLASRSVHGCTLLDRLFSKGLR